jgi:hypothetical protein
VVGLARRTLEQCQAQLENLARGRYSTADADESPNSPVNRLTAQARGSILATSAGSDLQWWQYSQSTRGYWRLNREAMERGVIIRRILIYRTWTGELEQLAKQQHEAGVQILRVSEEQLPAPLRLNTVIWDDVCAMEPEYNSAGEWINTHFVFGAQDLALSLDRFKLIESCAEPWPDLPAVTHSPS